MKRIVLGRLQNDTKCCLGYGSAAQSRAERECQMAMFTLTVPLKFIPDRKKRNLITTHLKAIDWVEKVTFREEMGGPVLKVEHTWDPQEAHTEVMKRIKEKSVDLTVN